MKKAFIVLLSLLMLAFALTACSIVAGYSNANMPTYTRVEEDIILFGEYPQTKVTDTTLASTLNNVAGTLPTSTNAHNWTSYGYYIEGKIRNFMWYIDVVNGKNKYRGVYFISYRPYDQNYDGNSADDTYQDDNGYLVSNIYWFKYEPIFWTILEEKDGKAFLLCDMIMDSQEFDYENGRFYNNYADSTIRRWLNDTFYNTAFNQYEQEIVLTTTVDNRGESAGYDTNKYACEDTEDKVFLLSYVEVVDYLGFYEYSMKKTTDYAQSQGVYTYSGSRESYLGVGGWWLRSPHHYNHYSQRVGSVGHYYSYDDVQGRGEGYVYDSYYGVVPALWIQL